MELYYINLKYVPILINMCYYTEIVYSPNFDTKNIILIYK